jgi:tetratricopeptide (TPR) repeat protein
MGKDEILDPVDHISIMRKRHLTRLLLFPILSTFALFSACAFPRITILKDPLKPEEHLNLGVIYEEEGEFDHAIREYRLASKRLPTAYLYIGNVHFQRKEWIKAEENYREAIKRDTKNADAYNNLAWLYYTKGEKLDEAERLALKAIELNPSKKDLYRDTLENIRRAKEKNAPTFRPLKKRGSCLPPER